MMKKSTSSAMIHLVMMAIAIICTLSFASTASAGPLKDKWDEAKETAEDKVKEKALEQCAKVEEKGDWFSACFGTHLFSYVKEGKAFQFGQYSKQGLQVLGVLLFSFMLMAFVRAWTGKQPLWLQAILASLAVFLALGYAAVFEAFKSYPNPVHQEMAGSWYVVAWVMLPLALGIRWRMFVHLRLCIQGHAFAFWLLHLTHPKHWDLDGDGKISAEEVEIARGTEGTGTVSSTTPAKPVQAPAPQAPQPAVQPPAAMPGAQPPSTQPGQVDPSAILAQVLLQLAGQQGVVQPPQLAPPPPRPPLPPGSTCPHCGVLYPRVESKACGACGRPRPQVASQGGQLRAPPPPQPSAATTTHSPPVPLPAAPQPATPPGGSGHSSLN